ncbi:MAG TPA: DUF2157 domain-containing protein [Dongiaceae bacterium]|jgi:uncharacterized membrane protein|nr:DUF2157 domain-containing protein [Dongiaceae bacterium]
MKFSDVQKLRDAGLISGEQGDKIIAHFGLKEEGGKFLAIVSLIGAVLVTAGLVLVISANWDEIPRGVKIAVGLGLMLGAHGAGWWLREVQGHYRKSGEALYLVGAMLFLGNIALLGQIYNLVSRPPNAILLWWAGIAALPWILRSKALHLLALLAFGIWFGLEVNEPGSLIFFGNDEGQILLYALLGLGYLGLGYVLRRTRRAEFAPATEKLGLLAFLLFAYPLTWGIWDHSGRASSVVAAWIFPALCGVALAGCAGAVSSLTSLTRQWRWTWTLTLAGAVALLAGQLYCAPESNWDYGWQDFGYHWVAVFGLFIFCLLQIQVGIQERSPFMVNLGITFIALDIVVTYIRLIGSMGRTGVMFLVSGVFLIGFGIYLEKKRRRLMMQIKAAAPAAGRTP